MRKKRNGWTNIKDVTVYHYLTVFTKRREYRVFHLSNGGHLIPAMTVSHHALSAGKQEADIGITPALRRFAPREPLRGRHTDRHYRQTRGKTCGNVTLPPCWWRVCLSVPSVCGLSLPELSVTGYQQKRAVNKPDMTWSWRHNGKPHSLYVTLLHPRILWVGRRVWEGIFNSQLLSQSLSQISALRSIIF